MKIELKGLLVDPRPGALVVASKPPSVYLIAGVNGSGKTTSIAKLAQHLKDQGKTILLAACDTFRAAAADQLSIWAARAGCEIVKGSPGADPASVAHDACQRALARHVDVLIVDTAGRLHTQTHLMRELEKIRNVIQRLIPGSPHEVLLVIDATNGQNAIRQAEVFTKSIGCTGVILTKLDGTAKGGVVVAVRQTMNLPVKFIGIGEALDDLQPFDADTFVESLFCVIEGQLLGRFPAARRSMVQSQRPGTIRGGTFIVAALWAKFRDELGSDPFLVLALLAALIALATTPLAFAVLGRLEWFKARRGRVMQRPEFSSIVVGMMLVMGIPAIFAALVIKSRSFDHNRYEFDPNEPGRCWIRDGNTRPSRKPTTPSGSKWNGWRPSERTWSITSRSWTRPCSRCAASPAHRRPWPSGFPACCSLWPACARASVWTARSNCSITRHRRLICAH